MTDLAAAPLARKLLRATVAALVAGEDSVRTRHVQVDLSGDATEIIIDNLQTIGPPLDEGVTRRTIMLFFKWFAECLLLNGDHGVPRIERLLLMLGSVSPAVKEAFELAVGLGPYPFTITQGDETYHQWQVPAFPQPDSRMPLTRRRKDGASTRITHAQNLFSFNIALQPLETMTTLLPPNVIAGCEAACKRWGNKTLLTRGTFVCVHVTDLRVTTAISDVRDLKHFFWYLEVYARTRFVPVVVSGGGASHMWNSKKDWREDGPLPLPYFVPLANRSVAIWCPQTNGFLWPSAADTEEPAPSWAPPNPVVIVLDESSSDEVFVVPPRARSEKEEEDALELSDDVVTGEKIPQHVSHTERVTALLLECVLTGRHPNPLIRVRHNLVLLKTLDEALSDDATARVGVALSTDGVLELQGLLEKLQIVERREAVYVRGPRVGRLREFPALGAVIDAFAASMVHRGGPCALLIREAVLLAPARFGLTADRMEEAFDGLKLIARPIAGTTDKFSTPTTTATISLTGSVMAGRATALTGARKASLLASLGAFDAFCMHLMHLIYECLHYRAALGFAADNANAAALEQALAGAFARPSIIENAKHVIALFYKPSDVLEGHIDTSKVATFITTRTRNADRRVLLNLADMGDDALKYEVAYDRWDVFFFPAAVWHQTSPIPTEREIVNLFY